MREESGGVALDDSMILLTSAFVVSISMAAFLHTVTETVQVVPVYSADNTALVFGTKETMVVPPGIPVPDIEAPLNHQNVSATVIAVLPLVAPIF